MKTIGEAATPAEVAAEQAIGAFIAWAGKPVRYAPAVPAVMSPVHRAVDSACWRVEVDGSPVFLKIANDDLPVPADVAASFAAATAAAGLGVAPMPRALAAAAGASAFDFLGDGWTTAHMDTLGDAGVIEKVIAAKRAINGLAPFGRPRDVFADIAGLHAQAVAAGAPLPPDIAGHVAAFAAAGAAVAAAGIDVLPCHADGVASNVMLGPAGAVLLVDFDEAGDADPLFDLAVTLNEAYPFEDAWRPGLEMARGSVRADELARCRLYGMADDLKWTLWSRIMDTTSPRGAVEFLKYAEWRLLRLRIALRGRPLAGLVAEL